jgi:MFS family permease
MQPGAWRALPVLMVLSSLALLDRQVLTLMVGPIKHDLAISDFEVGVLQGLVFALFYGVAGIPIGWLADRWPRRPIIWLGVTAWGLAASACGLVSTFAGLVMARLCVGIGEASFSPAANSMLADLFPARRLSFVLSVLSLGSNIGNGLAIGLGGLIVSFAQGGGALHLPWIGELRPWQFVFVVTGAPGLVLGALIFMVREPERRRRVESAGPPDFRRTAMFIARNRAFFTAHFLGFGLYSIAAWAFLSWMPAYMVRSFGWPISRVSIPLALIVAVGGGLGPLLSGSLVDRLFGAGRTDAHVRVYAVVAILMGGIGALAFQVRSPLLFLVLALPITGFMTLAPVATACLQIVSPNQMRGQINAIFILIMNGIGLGVGPPLVGAVTDFVLRDEARLGDAISIVFLAVTPLSALALWLGAAPMRACVQRASEWTR